MGLKELIEALAWNGFSQNQDMTLEDVYANTLQDAQYTAFASQNADILAKYLPTHGKMTMKEIRNSD